MNWLIRPVAGSLVTTIPAACRISQNREEFEKFPDAVNQLVMENGGITKYIKSSRTKIEVKGRRGKIRGGWQKLKEADEREAAMREGSFLDLYRFNSGEKSQNGHVSTSRTMSKMSLPRPANLMVTHGL